MVQHPDHLSAPPAQGDVQARAADLIQAVEDTYRLPTSYRDDTPLPPVGSALPVIQPGRAPMSQKAVDVSTVMLSASVATIPPGALAIGAMFASGYANPLVIGMVCAAPAMVAVPVFAVARLLRRAKEAAPDVHHHHYAGDVHQDHSQHTTTTRGVIARTTLKNGR